jgi:hypothetical protein
MYMGMQDGDVRKSNDPLGLIDKNRKVELLYQPACSIAASGAKYSPYGAIVKHSLQIG